MILAKLSTAKTISFGPILDSAGAEYTGAAVGDVKICKNNGTPAALNGSATLTHKEVGMYELVLTTSDLSEVGVITVQLSKTTYVARPIEINVLPALVYDSMIAGTDKLQVDLHSILNTALTETVAGYIAGRFVNEFDSSVSPYQRMARQFRGVSGTLWHVSPTGNDSNDGLTPQTAKLTPGTVFASLTAGDGIVFAAGTHTLASAPMWLYQAKIFGAGKLATTLTGDVDGAALIQSIANGNEIHDMTIQNTGTGPGQAGIKCTDQHGFTITNCRIIGTYDGLICQNCYNFRVDNCDVYGTYDGMNLTNCYQFLIRDCMFSTDCSYSTTADERAAIVVGSGIFSRCQFNATRAAAGIGKTSAVTANGVTVTAPEGLYFDDCIFNVNSSHADSTGMAVGVLNDTIAESYPQNVVVNGGTIRVQNTGSGDTYDLANLGGSLAVGKSLRYDSTKTTGTITLLPDAPPTAAENAAAARIELATELAYLDAAISDVPTVEEIQASAEAAIAAAGLSSSSSGDGDTSVDHDTGGTDALAYKTAGGSGIDNATIKAFLKSDYDADLRVDSYMKARTVTNSYGRWTNPMMLDAGETYTLVFYKAGVCGPDTTEITVAE